MDVKINRVWGCVMQSRGAVPGSGRSLFKAHWWICGVHDTTDYLTWWATVTFQINNDSISRYQSPFNDVPSIIHICESFVRCSSTSGCLCNWRNFWKTTNNDEPQQSFKNSCTQNISHSAVLISPCKVNEDLLPPKKSKGNGVGRVRFRIIILSKLLHHCLAVHCRNVAWFGQKITLQISLTLTAINI
jgi:hypothetical protein